MRDVAGFVAEQVATEERVLAGQAGPPPPPPGRWRAKLDRLRRRTGYRSARSRARVLRWRRKLNATRAGRLTVKIVAAVLGTATIVVGIVLLPLPGPGWLIIFAGLGILALEFHWARKLLVFAREQFRRWTDLVRQGSWIVKLASGAGLLLVILGALYLSARIAGIDIP